MDACIQHTETPTLLLVDDDKVFVRVLSKAMSRLGYTVWTATNTQEAYSILGQFQPTYAVVDLHLRDESGLDVIDCVKQHAPETITIMLSGYANLATAVSATKLGAVDCLPKPIDAEELHHALLCKGKEMHIPLSKVNVTEPTQARLQHILAHWEKNDRNTTKTAKAMKMHRRTVQRILNRVGVSRNENDHSDHHSAFGKLRRLYRVWTQSYERVD